MRRRTKAMATLTMKQCGDRELLERLTGAGMKGVRINSAHVEPEQLEAMVSWLRKLAPGVEVLMDTKGPELRTGPNAGGADIALAEGACIEIGEGGEACTPERICIATPGGTATLAKGAELTVDDGEIRLVMVSPTRAVVTKAGVLGERKSVNLDGCELPELPAVSSRDRENLHAAARLGIEMVAHSFVRCEADIEAVRRELQGSEVKLLAKVETAAAVKNLESIGRAADGLLVARGDLGAQISPYDIPGVQRRCAELCAKSHKPLIIATQILQSMMHQPWATRAELSDIALGTWQGAEYLLLCGETAQGAYPVECVEVLDQCITHCLR